MLPCTDLQYLDDAFVAHMAPLLEQAGRALGQLSLEHLWSTHIRRGTSAVLHSSAKPLISTIRMPRLLYLMTSCRQRLLPF